MGSMFELIQKLAPVPPTGLYSHVAPLKQICSDSHGITLSTHVSGALLTGIHRMEVSMFG